MEADNWLLSMHKHKTGIANPTNLQDIGRQKCLGLWTGRKLDTLKLQRKLRSCYSQGNAKFFKAEGNLLYKRLDSCDETVGFFW